jgi:malate permease and related proteins
MSGQYATILGVLAPVFGLMLAGYVLRLRGVLRPEGDSSLMNLVVLLLYPALIFRHILGNPALRDPANLLLGPVLGFATIIAGFGCAWWVGRRIGLQIGKGLRSFAFSIGIYNYGYIPLPLVVLLFADSGTTGVLLVYNIGVELALWTVGILLLAGSVSSSMVRRIFNPPVIAMLIALACNLLGLDRLFTPWMYQLLVFLSECAVPLALILAGATLADLGVGPSLLHPLRVPLSACILRLLVLPAGFLLIARFIPWATDELRMVLVIQSAMPAGIFPIVLAKHYGGDPRTAVQVVAATTIVSLITIPLWIIGGMAWLGS